MIVLTEIQKNNFCAILNEHKDLLIESGVWVEPVEIKNNLWILPETLLNESRLNGIKSLVENKFSEIVFREINEDELLKKSII